MPIYSCDGPDRDAVLQRAGEALRRGELVAFATETVYCLGANALDDAAVARIFAAKGRPSYNPLIVHVTDAVAAQQLVTQWPETARQLTAAFWPGPLSLVLPKSPVVPDRVTAGLDTVALRAPAHPLAQALLRAAGVPVAAPSANRFTELSPTRAEHVLAALGDRVKMILDGGPCAVGIESTVLDLSGAVPVLLRPGTIPKSALERLIGPIADAADVAGDSPRPSPGMVSRHYAPQARLRFFRALDGTAPPPEAGAVLFTDADAGVFSQAMLLPADAAGYARGLYYALHTLDDVGCREIWIQEVPGGPEWSGVRDRLARAANDHAEP